jgi:hypothetical protein
MSRLAQEQSAHLYLCLLIADLTQRYGPVIRQASVVGVLDAAFDVVVPEFGIEKRVHIDQIPIDVGVVHTVGYVTLLTPHYRMLSLMNIITYSKSIGPSGTLFPGWRRTATTNI